MLDKKIILYHANWSLCSQMVRVALYEKGITFEEIHIKLCDQYSEGENLNKSFLKINPLATVPAISIDEEIIVDSVKIIKRLNTIIGKNELDLYPTNESDINSIIRDTTITEGTKFATTIGTIIPVFSAPLIQFMIKKLPLKSIIKILFKHPRRDRKIIFLSMYFFNFSKKLPMIGIKKFVDELIVDLKFKAVLPPMQLSTEANKVVGKCTSLHPLYQRLAASPEISPITPPPIATILPLLGKLSLSSFEKIFSSVKKFLFSFPPSIMTKLKLVKFVIFLL